MRVSCGAVLPSQRFSEGERGQAPSEADVFLGDDLAMTNRGVRTPLWVWWLRGPGPVYTVEWQALMGAGRAGPFVSPYGSAGVVEWPPSVAPSWTAVRFELGKACKP